MGTFKNWTEAEVAWHNAKVAAPRVVDLASSGETAGGASEAKLHDQIIEECKRRGWYYVHSRMDRATTTALGVPDFIIAAPDGRTFWIEAKSKTGKLKSEQLGALQWLTRFGHRAEVVRSLEELLKVIG